KNTADPYDLTLIPGSSFPTMRTLTPVSSRWTMNSVRALSCMPRRLRTKVPSGKPPLDLNQRPERPPHVPHRLEPILRIPRQRLRHPYVDRPRQIWTDSGQARPRRPDHREDQLVDRLLRVERRLARERTEHDRAERVEIDPGIQKIRLPLPALG